MEFPLSAKVNSDGNIASEATLDLSGAVFILTHPAVNLQITLNRRLVSFMYMSVVNIASCETSAAR